MADLILHEFHYDDGTICESSRIKSNLYYVYEGRAQKEKGGGAPYREIYFPFKVYVKSTDSSIGATGAPQGLLVGEEDIARCLMSNYKFRVHNIFMSPFKALSLPLGVMQLVDKD